MQQEKSFGEKFVDSVKGKDGKIDIRKLELATFRIKKPIRYKIYKFNQWTIWLWYIWLPLIALFFGIQTLEGVIILGFIYMTLLIVFYWVASKFDTPPL